MPMFESFFNSLLVSFRLVFVHEADRDAVISVSWFDDGVARAAFFVVSEGLVDFGEGAALGNGKAFFGEDYFRELFVTH